MHIMKRVWLLLLSVPGLLAVSCGEKVPQEIAVSSVTLSQSNAEMLEGETVQLIATVLPSDASDKSVTWASSKQSVATVSPSGLVFAVSEGVSTITASAGGKSATCAITVTRQKIEVTSITLDRSSLSMEVGGTALLVAKVSPADATDKTVKWTSSDASVASVDGNGVVSAKLEGSAVITASAGEKSAACLVTVARKIIPVQSVTLDRTAVTLEVGASTTLVATVSPSDATDKTVTWTNSDNSVLSLDGNGKITALKEGTATITAVAGDKSASCSVTVSKSVVPVTSVTLDRTSVTFNKGESTKLSATVTPSDATDKTVSWSSSDMTVVRVEQDGTLNALRGGTATVYAKAGECSASCHVTVLSPVTGVTIDRESLPLVVGETATLVATIQPEDATEKTVTWTSSDSSVASVDASGKVTGVKKGSATITASAGERSATCVVTVSNIPFAISPTEVSVSGSGGRFEVTVTCSAGYNVHSESDWVTEKTVNGKTHVFEVAPNPGSEPRNGLVVFCEDEGTCLPCVVNQAAGGTFSISPVSVEMDAAGGSFTVKVSCSIGYHINSLPGWVSEVTEPSAIQEHVFKVAANSGEDERSGVIVFCDDKGTCLSCTVRQKGRVPDSAGGGSEDLPDGDPIKW